MSDLDSIQYERRVGFFDRGKRTDCDYDSSEEFSNFTTK